jgi:hypothetical protein
MSEDKLFTLEEANGLLPQITLAIEKMQRIGIQVRDEIEALSQAEDGHTVAQLSTQQLLRMKPSLRPLFEDMAQLVQEIEQHGCHFKGLELGLVDFRGRIGDEVVYLCWQYGEQEITFYHPLDEGFVGRRPLDLQGRKPQYYQ